MLGLTVVSAQAQGAVVILGNLRPCMTRAIASIANKGSSSPKGFLRALLAPAAQDRVHSTPELSHRCCRSRIDSPSKISLIVGGLSTKLGPHQINISGYNSSLPPRLMFLISPLTAWDTVDVTAHCPVHLPLRTWPNAEMAPHVAKKATLFCIDLPLAQVDPLHLTVRWS